MATTSPTQRSLKLLREQGYTCWIVEVYNRFAKKRLDLFNFADILAIKPGEILAVQTTTASHLSERIKKITAEPMAKTWCEAGGLIVCHGWRKYVKPDEHGNYWRPNTTHIQL